FEDDLRRREYRNAYIVELRLSLSRRHVGVGAREACGLEVLVGVAIKRHRFPLSAYNRAHRYVQSDFTRKAIHAFTNVVGRIAIVVGAQLRWIAERHPNALTAEFNPGIGDAIAEFGVENPHAGVAEQIAKIAVRPARLDVGGEIGAYAPRQTGRLRQHKIYPARDRHK